MRKHTPYNHYPAPTCSVALHVGLLVWLVWPHLTAKVPPQQQVVDVSVVMISSLSPEQVEVLSAATPESAQSPPVEQPSARHTPAPQPKHAVKKAGPKHEQHVASTPPTTGPQVPKATERVAAVTKPIFDAMSLHNQPPAYPDDARRRGIEGTVTLEVNVTPEGSAQDVTITHSSGYALLDRVAHDAIRHWHFIPARRGDDIVEAKVLVPVEFRLE